MKKMIYPGTKEVERLKAKKTPIITEEEPDFIGNCPNYDKFKGWSIEKILVWLNVD